jgi:hypothetical protein
MTNRENRRGSELILFGWDAWPTPAQITADSSIPGQTEDTHFLKSKQYLGKVLMPVLAFKWYRA